MKLPVRALAATVIASGALLSIAPVAHAAAILTGKVEAAEPCAKDPMEAWLSAGSTLLHQVEVPQNGTFEFHVNSGQYNLVVISAGGCLAEVRAEARENDTKHYVLRPTPAAKPGEDPKGEVKRSALDWLVPSAYATGISSMHPWSGGNCPYCGPTYFAPPVSFMPSYNPWWSGYGAMTYPNFYYPGPWSGGGITGGMYPGHGGGFAAKPVLYVNGPDGTAIKIRTRLGAGSNWLVTVPSHQDKGWSGTIRNNRFKSDDADYRYVFYDYRFDQKKLQDTKGFCTKRDGLIARMSAELKSAGFAENEIQDFASFWSIKIPPSDRYCVYPQTQAELRAVAPLEIEPKPATFTQLLFMVQPGENLDGKGKFRKAPTVTWNPLSEKRDPAATQSNESKTGVHIREWGVGFFAGRGIPKTPSQ